MLNWIVWNRTDFCLKLDLTLNNLQRLICHKTQTTEDGWLLHNSKYYNQPEAYMLD